MTDRQRAFISALVSVVKTKRFSKYHRLGVKRLPEESVMYEFRGTWLPESISIYDDKNNSIYDDQFLTNPWGVKFAWQGSKRTERLKVLMPEGFGFYGEDGDFFSFTGNFLSPDKVEIRDNSQDKDKYVYRITY